MKLGFRREVFSLLGGPAVGSKVRRSPEQSLTLDNIRKPLVSEPAPPGCVHQPVGLHHEEHLHGQIVGLDFWYIHHEVDASCPLNRFPLGRGAKAGPVVVEGMMLVLG